MARPAAITAAACLLLANCVREAPPPRAEVAGPPDLQVGDTVAGTLAGSDPLVNGSFEDRWRFDLAAGQRVAIELRSDSFDATLLLRGPDGETLAENDDARGHDAAVTYRAARAGRYALVARSGKADALRVAQPRSGDYTLSLREVPDSVLGPGEVGYPSIGDTIVGVLETGDSLTEPARGRSPVGHLRPDARRGLVDYFRLLAGRTGTVAIELTSEQFDPYLAVLDSGEHRWLHDDDGAGRGNARIRMRVDSGRGYSIAAASFGADAGTGVYHLAVRMTSPGRETSHVGRSVWPLMLPRLETRLCQGKSISFAAPYDRAGQRPHPTEVAAAEDGPFQVADWNSDDQDSLELVLCLSHTEAVMQVCHYSGPSITRYRHRWVGRLYEARMRRLVTEARAQGDMPRACGFSEPYSLTRIEGSMGSQEAALSALQPELAPWVLGPTVAADSA